MEDGVHNRAFEQYFPSNPSNESASYPRTPDDPASNLLQLLNLFKSEVSNHMIALLNEIKNLNRNLSSNKSPGISHPPGSETFLAREGSQKAPTPPPTSLSPNHLPEESSPLSSSSGSENSPESSPSNLNESSATIDDLTEDVLSNSNHHLNCNLLTNQ